MKNFWKVLLIVFAVLILLGVIAASIFVCSHGFDGMWMHSNRHGGFPVFPGRPGGFGMMPGFMLFGLPFRLLTLAIPVGLFVLLVWVIVRWTSQKKISKIDANTLNRQDDGPLSPASAKTCLHCGKTAHEDWVTCPYCSEKL